MGTGTTDIIDFANEANLMEPEFIQDDQFRVVIYRPAAKDSGAIGGAIGGAIELTERQLEIMKLIKQNNKIAYREIAERLGINNSAVQTHIKKLKEKGVLNRVGGTRGYWKIMINDNDWT